LRPAPLHQYRVLHSASPTGLHGETMSQGTDNYAGTKNGTGS